MSAHLAAVPDPDEPARLTSEQMLAMKVAELTEDKSDLEARNRAKKRVIKELRQQIADLLDEAADTELVKKCWEFWAEKAGYDGTTTKPKARFTMSGTRAQNIRWVIRTNGKNEKGARVFCIAVVGMLNNPYYCEKNLDDVRHVCIRGGKYSDDLLFQHYKRGLEVLGVKA